MSKIILKNITAKISKKIPRVINGIINFIITSKFKYSNNIDHNKLNISADNILFNISAYRVGDDIIYMAREYFDDVYYKGPASIYIGKSSLFDNSIVFHEIINIEILKLSINNFLRLEDPRVFELNGSIYAICVCILLIPDNIGTPQIEARQILIEVENCCIVSYKIFETGFKIEKNWAISKLKDQEMDLIYSISPLIVIKSSLMLENKTQHCKIEGLPNFEFRNSTNYIELDCCQYSVGHRTIDLGFKYVYLHFFIRINEDLKIQTSAPFVFKSYGDEFATSLVDLRNDNWAIYYSDHDRGNFRVEFNVAILKNISWLQ